MTDKKPTYGKLKVEGIENIGLSVEDFARVLDFYYGSVFIANGNGIILFFNEMYNTAFGLSRKDYLGKHVSCLLEEGLFDRSLTLEVIEKKEAVTGVVKDKSGRELFVHASPIFDEDGNVAIVVQFAQEKTMITEFLEEIDKSKKQIERFYSVLEYIKKSIGNGMELVYKSESMTQVCSFAKVVAKTEGAILLYGESGTGKEMLARLIYEESKRSKEVFIPVNCAAIPTELIEAELFGYIGGSFTGAKKEGKKGLFELANKGTLFLDEIGDLPLLLQSKLLRVLETGEVSRLGATIPIKTDVRIISATNRNLKVMIKDQTFREDLYHRLNVIPITIPPLRERPEDIEVLAEYFLNMYNKKYRQSRTISNLCMEKLKNYAWSGNVRELRNVIHRMVITSKEDVISEIPDADAFSVTTKPENSHFIGKLKDVIRDYEKTYISTVIKECGGNVTEAARKLGIHRSFIYRKILEKR